MPPLGVVHARATIDAVELKKKIMMSGMMLTVRGRKTLLLRSQIRLVRERTAAMMVWRVN